MVGVRVVVEHVSKVYVKGTERIEVLKNLSLELAAGERVCVLGPSGSGKSTFLHLLGMLDRPTTGRIQLDEHDLSKVSESQLPALRNRHIGFVFQAHNLLPEHTALGNVMVPVRLAGGSRAVAQQRAEMMLVAVGLQDRLNHMPGELSGGEQQRVALARALVMGPGLVLADEPTGNLDVATAGGVFDLMLELNRQLGSTLIVVTHSRDLASRFPRRLSLTQGHFREGY